MGIFRTNDFLQEIATGAMGQFVRDFFADFLQGDSRALPLDSVGAVITSPPYEGSISPGKDGIDRSKAKDGDRDKNQSRQDGGSATYRGYVDSVITSPPYEQAQNGGGIAKKGHYDDPGLAQRAYSDRAMGIDAVVTSPPYEGSAVGGNGGELTLKRMRKGVADGQTFSRRSTDYVKSGNWISPPYTMDTQNQGNLGNLKGPAFWEAVTAVFQECQRVLRPGGNFVIISKGCIRDGQYVDLPGQFKSTMEGLGFELRDHWRRQLWARSFWRTLQAKKHPESWDDRLDYEEIHCYRKGG